MLGGADLAQRGSNFELKDIYTFNIPDGDTIFDKAAIELGFSIYNFYISHNYIKADKILSDILADRVFIEYFKQGEWPDDKNK